MINKNDTTFLRACAILLILNSHMDPFYPISHIATGGMIGNALFFMLSSYGLYISHMSNPIQNFKDWYSKRILRIYPSVWITVCIITIPYSLYDKSLTTENLLEKLSMFFYPPFWFLQALMFYYIFVYYVLFSSKYVYRTIFAITIATYVYIYLFHIDLFAFSIESMPFRLIFYFAIVLYGIKLASLKENIFFNGIIDVIGFFICLLGIYFHKYLMHSDYLPYLQIVQHVLVFPFLYYSLKIAKAPFIANTLMCIPLIGRTISWLSIVTLELFMVNNSTQKIMLIIDLTFPYNVIIYILITFIFAAIINNLSSRLKRTFNGGPQNI